MRPIRKRIVSRKAASRGAFTILELVVAIAIITVLVGLVFVSGRAAHGWMKKSTAQQQMALIASAIEAYSDAWPSWKGGQVVVADKGWPDFIPGRLFPSIGLNSFNLVSNFNVDAFYNIEDGISYAPNDDKMTIEAGDAVNGAECLFYALTSATGGGPFFTGEAMEELIFSHPDEFYPIRSGQPDLMRSEFVDPWGVPYRYFWVYRDDQWTVPAGWTWPEQLPKGLVAVAYGAFHDVQAAAYGYIDNPNFIQNSGRRQKAVAYVLESAGPDKRFGNIWQQSPSLMDMERAEDNLIVMP